MKLKVKLTLILIIIILAFLTIPALRNLEINPFQKVTLRQSTTESIKNIKVSEFRSASYTYKTLFPYDFITGSPNWGSILYQNKRFLSDEEKLNIEFYNECKKIGIDLNKNKYFFVITTKATAGFNINEYIDNPIMISNELNKKIILRTPISKILSIEILDKTRDQNFPEIDITPGQWSDLITLLLPKIEQSIIDRGLLTKSDESNKKFIEELFYSLGWEAVDFK